jgi:hypothetical protein
MREKLNSREYALIAAEINAGRSVSWVDENVEGVLFSWFCLGKDTKSIAELTAIPEAIVILTKMKYKWSDKYAAIKAQGKSPVTDVAKDVAKQVFALTMMAIKRDIEEVMRGIKDPRNSIYVPKTTSQFAELCKLIEDPMPEEAPEDGGTRVQVNVVQQGAPLTAQSVEVKQLSTPKSKLDLLKALASDPED